MRNSRRALVRLPPGLLNRLDRACGKLEMLLAAMASHDGSLGIGTGWDESQSGSGNPRPRGSNAAFHAPITDVPVILIGNGTGIASLRAMLKQRIAEGRFRNWLIFGERNADRDFHYRDEIVGWKDSGRIERLDLAFSRDQPERVHVQHRLQAAAAELRRWLAAGAVIQSAAARTAWPPASMRCSGCSGRRRGQYPECQRRYRRDVY